jgi:hypothetical protein
VDLTTQITGQAKKGLYAQALKLKAPSPNVNEDMDEV